MGTVRRRIRCPEADAHIEIVVAGDTKTVAIFPRQLTFPTVISAFARTGVFIITLILQGEMQAVDEAEEIAVTVGGHAVSTTGHVNVGLGVVSPPNSGSISVRFNVVDHAVVTAIVQRPAVGKLQAGKAETGREFAPSFSLVFA